jgi:hypothetical protein
VSFSSFAGLLGFPHHVVVEYFDIAEGLYSSTFKVTESGSRGLACLVTQTMEAIPSSEMSY